MGQAQRTRRRTTDAGKAMLIDKFVRLKRAATKAAKLDRANPGKCNLSSHPLHSPMSDYSVSWSMRSGSAFAASPSGTPSACPVTTRPIPPHPTIHLTPHQAGPVCMVFFFFTERRVPGSFAGNLSQMAAHVSCR